MVIPVPYVVDGSMIPEPFCNAYFEASNNGTQGLRRRAESVSSLGERCFALTFLKRSYLHYPMKMIRHDHIFLKTNLGKVLRDLFPA